MLNDKYLILFCNTIYIYIQFINSNLSTNYCFITTSYVKCKKKNGNIDTMKILMLGYYRAPFPEIACPQAI